MTLFFMDFCPNSFNFLSLSTQLSGEEISAVTEHGSSFCNWSFLVLIMLVHFWLKIKKRFVSKHKLEVLPNLCDDLDP